jgi:hypothetical protein
MAQYAYMSEPDPEWLSAASKIQFDFKPPTGDIEQWRNGANQALQAPRNQRGPGESKLPQRTQQV